MGASARQSRHALAVLVCVALWPVAAAAQTSVGWLVFTPSVLSANTTGPLLIEAQLAGTGTPTRVTLAFNPAGTTASDLPLRDDGAEGDRTAGDRIYSVRVPVAPILAARTLDDVNRVGIGFLDVFNGAARVRYNMFVDVYTSVIGEYPITRVSQFVQATTRLVNLHDPAYFGSLNVVNVVREFYRWFPDEYDFVNVVYDPQRFENRTHSVITNGVGGIGLALTDGSRSWGSGGRLLGYSHFPIARFYDGAETGYLHELGHQWINHMRVPPFAPGVPHWPYSSMASGVMGISIGGTGGQGGNYSCVITEDPPGYVLTTRTGAPGFTDLDLYLMGLMPASEVRDQFVFADQAAAPQQRCAGEVYTGAMTRVRVGDVIAALGARTPAFGNAPRTFRAATILVTRDGLASPEMMWLYSYLTERAEWRARVPTHAGFAKELGQPFFVATRGRGELQVNINLQRPDFAVAPGEADLTVPAGAPARFQISAFSRQSTFDQPVTLSCESLPANATCAFDQAALIPGAGGQTTVVSIGTANVARGRHVVLITGRAGGEKHSTAVTVTVQ